MLQNQIQIPHMLACLNEAFISLTTIVCFLNKKTFPEPFLSVEINVCE